MIIECWRRGSHDWDTLIGNHHTTNNIKDCQRLCQQTNTPDCEYFTYLPSNKKCWLMTASTIYNGIRVHSENAKKYLSGTKRCKNGKYQSSIFRFIVLKHILQFLK